MHNPIVAYFKNFTSSFDISLVLQLSQQNFTSEKGHRTKENKVDMVLLKIQCFKHVLVYLKGVFQFQKQVVIDNT